MPFTLAHPAAAYPLRGLLGRFGSPSAFVVGSMVPDLPYALPLGVDGLGSHGPGGLVWFCVPAGIGCWLVYCLLVRPFALALLPTGIARRVPQTSGPRLGLSDGLGFLGSLLLGALTHDAWDSFTHVSGAAVQAAPALRTQAFLFGHIGLPLYSLFQHASTLAGFAVLGLWGVGWFYRTRPAPRPGLRPLPSWLRGVLLAAVVLPTATAGVWTLWIHLSGSSHQLPDFRLALGHAVFAAGRAFVCALLSAALAWRAGVALRSDTRLPPT